MLTRKTKADIILHYYELEGGSVDHPDDLGGATLTGGLTLDLLVKCGYNANTTCIPYSAYEKVMTDEFWSRMRLDEVLRHFPDVADVMYGWGINSGVQRPTEALQRHLNACNKKGTLYADIDDDGIMGNKTLAALNAYLNCGYKFATEESIVLTILAYQRAYYTDISLKRTNNESFTHGWFNRVAETRKRILK